MTEAVVDPPWSHYCLCWSVFFVDNRIGFISCPEADRDGIPQNPKGFVPDLGPNMDRGPQFWQENRTERCMMILKQSDNTYETNS